MSLPARDRYGVVAIVLHWLIAAAIVLQIVLAWRMDGPRSPETFALVQLHKSVGMTILALSLVRLLWRLGHPPPPFPPGMATWERRLAHVTHWGFYAVMIGMPLTGWIMVSASALSVPTLLYGVVPWPDLSGVSGEAWRDVGHEGHELLAKLLFGLLALHVAGALKHQLLDREAPVLGRMAPGAVAGRWREPRLLAIAAAAVSVIAFGVLLEPPAAGGGAPAAVPSPSPAAAPARVEPVLERPVEWAVRPGSTLGFETRWSGQPVRGRFERWNADIRFSPQALDRSRVRVRIELASVATGDAQRDAALPSDLWLGAASEPEARFEAERFERIGDGYVARGELTLRGVTRPQDLTFRLTWDGPRVRMAGRAVVDRTAFGVGRGEWAGSGQIPAEVAITVDLAAVQAP